jgi:hypothetical protein
VGLYQITVKFKITAKVGSVSYKFYTIPLVDKPVIVNAHSNFLFLSNLRNKGAILGIFGDICTFGDIRQSN